MIKYAFWYTSFAAVAVSRVFAAVCFANFHQSQFTNCLLIASTYALHWSVNASIITIGVDIDVPSSSNNWIGLGLSPFGGMHGADIWVLLKNSTGGYYIQDSFATTTTIPVADASQDVILLTAPPLSSTNTVFSFMRAIKTCDSNDLEVVQGTKHHMIWAYGLTNTALGYHGTNSRGIAMVNLYPLPSNSLSVKAKAKAKASVDQLKASSDLQTVSIQFPNVTVPTAGTTYLCTHWQAPADQKYHVVQYEGIINTDLVHHLVLYGCVGAPKKFGDVYPCLAQMERKCSKFTLAWAPGVGTTIYPAEAGFAIGTGVNGIRYFSLQIHYNNPNGLSGIVDNSGLRLFYTNVLRIFDIGILTLGNYSIDISGNNENYTETNWNVCPSTCTKQFPTNLTVVSTAFHMHTLGYNITTRHIRNGHELIPLGVRQYYDFSFQSATGPLDPAAVIMPGDALLTKCTYIPTAGMRTNRTKFGESTSDEMCFDFLTYYPAMTSIDTCLSDPDDPYGFCATDALVANATVSQMFTNGWVVPAPMPSFTAYKPPVCVATFKQATGNNILKPGGALGGGAMSLLLIVACFVFLSI
ncbi:UNVERIFIED_CONTAM: hypothetical protein HDU68_007452 [Siphonaria sp. JEL0065]|nr:hypothetical protein HDU68_007452 [Siphonaria sp. JEL0065]